MGAGKEGDEASQTGASLGSVGPRPGRGGHDDPRPTHPFSERVAERVLSRALAGGGGAFTVESRTGSLAGAWTLEGVRLSIPPSLRFTARHVHMRLSRTALLAGTLLLKICGSWSPACNSLLPKSKAPHEGSAPLPFLAASFRTFGGDLGRHGGTEPGGCS